MGLDDDQNVREVETTAGWPDGRRRFGSVSEAIVDVLSNSRSEMAVKAWRRG